MTLSALSLSLSLSLFMCGTRYLEKFYKKLGFLPTSLCSRRALNQSNPSCSVTPAGKKSSVHWMASSKVKVWPKTVFFCFNYI